MSEEIALQPVYLSPDMFRHEPIMVRMVSTSLGAYRNMELKSRYVRRDGAIVEFQDLLPETHPFDSGTELELRIFLPYDESPLTLTAVVDHCVRKAVGKQDQVLSIVSLRFKEVSIETSQRLQAHDLIVQTVIGLHRSARVPVKLPVSVQGAPKQVDFLMVDLSMTGAFLSVSEPFDSDEELAISFRLPFQKETVSLNASIVWKGNKKTTQDIKHFYGLGLQFQRSSPETRVALAMFCAKSTLFPAI